MSKSYEERMAEKYNFLKKDKDTSSEVTNKNTEHDEKVSSDEVIDVEGQEEPSCPIRCMEYCSESTWKFT